EPLTHGLIRQDWKSFPPCCNESATLAAMTEEKRRSAWFWVFLGGGLFIAFIAVVSLLGYFAVQSMGAGGTSFGDSIGVIDVDGVILAADKTVDNLRKFDQDD